MKHEVFLFLVFKVTLDFLSLSTAGISSRIILGCEGAVLCLIGCLAASLSSTY